MRSEAQSVSEYLASLPEERREAVTHLREILRTSLLDEFEEIMSYGMISYVVPKRVFPAGYHVNPEEALPFISLASQKNHIALYRFGLYFFEDIREWFIRAYEAETGLKADVGKSCIRLKSINKIPYSLIRELCGKVPLEDFIRGYAEKFSTS